MSAMGLPTMCQAPSAQETQDPGFHQLEESWRLSKEKRGKECETQASCPRIEIYKGRWQEDVYRMVDNEDGRPRGGK